MTVKGKSLEQTAYLTKLQAAQDTAESLYMKLLALTVPNEPYMGTLVDLRQEARYKALGILHNLENMGIQED